MNKYEAASLLMQAINTVLKLDNDVDITLNAYGPEAYKGVCTEISDLKSIKVFDYGDLDFELTFMSEGGCRQCTESE